MARNFMGGAEALADPISETRTARRGAGEPILVVEDDALVRDVMVQTVEALGYRVLVAEDGPSALRILDRSPEIALLFAGVVLPGGLDGLDVACEALGRHPGLRVVFSAGRVPRAVSEFCRGTDSACAIQKPFGKNELAETLANALDRDQGV